MGRIAGSYGVRGWVKVAPGGGATQGLVDAREWWIGGQPYKVVAKVHGAAVVAQLSGVHTREEALALKGSKVSVRREQMTDPGEGHYYLADLIGLEVVNEQGEVLGEVKRLFSNGAQDVMEVQAAGGKAAKTHLLPWVPAVVKDVSLSEGKILVEWQLDW